MTRLLLAGAVVVALAAPLPASLLVPAEFREIVADAGLIARGRVTDVRGVADRDRGVESIATVAVDRVLKGEAASFIAVRVPGGEVGRYRSIMVGAPRFRTGDQAVFFLTRAADGVWRPVGLSMGVYRVQVDARTRAAVVAPPVVAGVTANATGAVARGDARRRPLPVSEFESLVALVLASQPAASRAAR